MVRNLTKPQQWKLSIHKHNVIGIFYPKSNWLKLHFILWGRIKKKIVKLLALTCKRTIKTLFFLWTGFICTRKPALMQQSASLLNSPSSWPSSPCSGQSQTCWLSAKNQRKKSGKWDMFHHNIGRETTDVRHSRCITHNDDNDQTNVLRCYIILTRDVDFTFFLASIFLAQLLCSHFWLTSAFSQALLTNFWRALWTIKYRQCRYRILIPNNKRQVTLTLRRRVPWLFWKYSIRGGFTYMHVYSTTCTQIRLRPKHWFANPHNSRNANIVSRAFYYLKTLWFTPTRVKCICKYRRKIVCN